MYNYIYRGGTRGDNKETRPNGPAARTDTGRTVYGGGGITPDEIVSPDLMTGPQGRLRSPIFFFARDLANGRSAGFEKYQSRSRD